MNNAEYQAAKKKKYLQQMQANPDDKRHGTATGYTYGCRCPKCVAANKKRKSEYNDEHAVELFIARRNRQYEILKEMRADPNHPNHGTYYGHECGCRCEKCKAVYREWWRKAYARYLQEMKANPDDPRHGTVAGYNYGCRCEKCKAASKEYQLRRKEKHAKIMKHSKAKVYKELQANPDDPRHGTVYGYGCGCRCEKCKNVKLEYTNKRILKKQHEKD